MSIKKVESKRYSSGFGYQIDFREGEKRIRRTFETRALAKQVQDKLNLNAISRRFGLPVASSVTLVDLVERRIKETQDNDSAGYEKGVLYRFIGKVGASTLVEQIKSSHLFEYAVERVQTGLKPNTITRELSTIRACLNAGSKYFSSLESYKVPGLPKLEPPKVEGRPGWFASDADFNAALRDLLPTFAVEPTQLQLLLRLDAHRLCSKRHGDSLNGNHKTTLRDWLKRAGYSWEDVKNLWLSAASEEKTGGKL